MSTPYKMHTEIALDRTKREIVACINAWPGATFISIGDYRDQANAFEAVVVFDFNGQRIRVVYDRLCCHRCNMRAIFKTLDGLRLMYKREMGDILLNTVSQMLALPGATYIDPYELLGVRPDAPIEIAEAAAKALLRQHHPDKHPEWSADDVAKGTAMCAQINEALERVKQDKAAAA